MKLKVSSLKSSYDIDKNENGSYEVQLKSFNIFQVKGFALLILWQDNL